MNIQYCHARVYETIDFFPDIGGMEKFILDPKGGETVALEVPESWFLAELQPGEFFEKKVGRAKCSSEDNYCKKTGRELAFSRMKATRLTCTHNNWFGEVRFVVLEDPQGNEYTLRLYENCKRPHFIQHE